MTSPNGGLTNRMKQSIRVSPANRLLVRFQNLRIVSQQLHVLEFHSSAGVIVRIVGGKKKSLGTQEFDRLRQFRLLGLDGEIKIVLKIVTRRLFILFEKNMGRIQGSGSPQSFTYLG